MGQGTLSEAIAGEQSETAGEQSETAGERIETAGEQSEQVLCKS